MAYGGLILARTDITTGAIREKKKNLLSRILRKSKYRPPALSSSVAKIIDIYDTAIRNSGVLENDFILEINGIKTYRKNWKGNLPDLNGIIKLILRGDANVLILRMKSVHNSEDSFIQNTTEFDSKSLSAESISLEPSAPLENTGYTNIPGARLCHLTSFQDLVIKETSLYCYRLFNIVENSSAALSGLLEGDYILEISGGSVLYPFPSIQKIIENKLDDSDLSLLVIDPLSLYKLHALNESGANYPYDHEVPRLVDLSTCLDAQLGFVVDTKLNPNGKYLHFNSLAPNGPYLNHRLWTLI